MNTREPVQLDYKTHILIGVRENGVMTGKAIGAKTHMHKTKVSRAVAQLEQRKLISRRANRADLREAFLALTPAGRDTLDGVIRTLTQRADLSVAVEGHTDPFGSSAYNDALSTRRAQAVVDYLTRGGIAATRIGAKGFGEQCLLLDDDADRPTRPRAEHRVNRRVEIWSVGNAGVATTCRPRQ